VLPEAVFINGRYQMIRIDSTGSIFNMDGARAITDYSVVSEIPPPMAANLPSSNGSGLSESVYLRTPRNLDPRIPELAQQISADQPTPFLKAQKIERYLSSHYRYTLQLPLIQPKDPIANFLFYRKVGHCEYFASSMVVMLRTIGIPSRIVNGFHGGEFNDVTGSYIVRANDAHSWVEAYFPGYGWYTFDPTPASVEVPNAWNRLYLYADAMREFWHDWVVNYDTGHQTTLGFVMLHQGHSQFEKTRKWFDSFYRSCLHKVKAVRLNSQHHAGAWTVWIALGFFLLMVLLIGPKLYLALRRMHLASKPRLEPHSAATIWYGRALKVLAKRGLRKASTQTPEEFIQTVNLLPVRKQLQQFTLHYERARFGHSAVDAEKLPELYRELELAAKD
jgi:hypothetical protein